MPLIGTVAGNFWAGVKASVPNPVLNNLVLYYSPGNSLSYSGTGTTVNSLVSPNLTGAMSNITYTSPYFSYNGSSSTVSIADSASLEPGSGDFTIEAWVYYTTITGSSRIIAAKTNGGLAADWGYGLRTNNVGSTYLEVGNGTTSVTSPSFTAVTGQWYQIVGVWTNTASNSIALYQNGTLVGSNSHSFASVKDTTNPLYLGSFNNGQFSQWLNGRTGIIRYYNTALSDSEILQNFNANRNIYGLSGAVIPTPTPTPTNTPTPTPTLTNTPTPTPTPGTDQLRAVLTSNRSITAYDAAPIGAWVPIVSSEYFALSSTLAGIQWHGTNETGVRGTATGTSFNSTLTLIMPSGGTQQIAPSGTYFVGFMVRPGTGNTTYTWYPMTSYVFKGTYFSTGSATHVAPASVTSASAFNAYFIRKAPVQPLSADAYTGFAGNGAGNYSYYSLATNTPMPTAYGTTGTYLGGTAASAAAPWTNYNSNLPIFQILGTTTKSW